MKFNVPDLKTLTKQRRKKLVGGAVTLAGLAIGLIYHGTMLYYLGLLIAAFGMFLFYDGKPAARYRAPDDGLGAAKSTKQQAAQYIGPDASITDPESGRSFSLHDVVRNEIETTGDGPFDEGFYWIFHLQSEAPVRMAGPIGHMQGIFDVLNDFEGADFEKTIQASATVVPARFLIWESRGNA